MRQAIHLAREYWFVATDFCEVLVYGNKCYQCSGICLINGYLNNTLVSLASLFSG